MMGSSFISVIVAALNIRHKLNEVKCLKNILTPILFQITQEEVTTPCPSVPIPGLHVALWLLPVYLVT